MGASGCDSASAKAGLKSTLQCTRVPLQSDQVDPSQGSLPTPSLPLLLLVERLRVVTDEALLSTENRV